MKLKHIYIIADTEKSLSELSCGAAKLAESFSAVCFGSEELAENAKVSGASKVFQCVVPAGCMAEEYAKAIAEQIKSDAPELVMLDSSVRSRLMAGKVAAYLGTAVTSGTSSINTDDGICVSRMIYGGAAVRSEKLTAPISVVTLGAGVFAGTAKPEARKCSVSALQLESSSAIKVISKEDKKEATSNLAVARCIVDVGRGISQEEDLEMMKKLAVALGGDVGCSRPVSEVNGWMPRARYIGVTGVITKPDLCICIGISGQVHHLVGINEAKTIVAINKDKNAAIFKAADFGIVGDLYKVLPALLERLS